MLKRFFVYGSTPDGNGWGDFYEEFDEELDAKLYALSQLEKGCSVCLMDGKLKTSLNLTLRWDGQGQS